jgi:hypothetical protein
MKHAARKWHKITQKTLYLRRRDEQVVKKWNEKVTKFALKGWLKRGKIEKLLCTRVAKFVKRMSYLDIAHGF